MTARSLLVLGALALVRGYAPALRPAAGRRPHLARAAVRCAADGELMQVQVPDGMAAGMTLRVDTPSGLMDVQIPEGVGAGQSFQMRMPVAATPAPAAAAPAWPPPPPPLPPAELLGGGELLGGMISREDNPYVTSKAQRMRAKFGDAAVDGRQAQRGGRAQLEDQLGADLEQFKSEAGLAGRNLAGGANVGDRRDDGGEVTALQRVINTLGTVLTYNFFIIVTFFAWFVSGVVGQFGFESYGLINAFRGCWDVLIMPLLTTHMTLTFLSFGLEKLAQADDA